MYFNLIVLRHYWGHRLQNKAARALNL